ncbi:MAG TPA: efflux RND transporter periplasmic adaptor subunit [Tepidisphaeraceae bacterium]|nr:efflux RND transporter periplasmic adaptor subunit [Tepidisphaeraceae bacterium]
MATELHNQSQRDLRALSRVGPADAPISSPPASRIPRPPLKWKTRVWLPVGILVAALMLLSHVLGDALSTATPVRVVPVVVKTTAETGGAVTVQAPGWVEPAPYPISVPALADGTVSEVLVLEGQPVKTGDIVARLVADDAQLALARADAELKQQEAALGAAQADWDNPVERTRAVATAEGMVAETRAQLEQLGAEVAAETARADELRDQLQRNQRLFEQNAATETEVVQTRLQLAAQEATLRAKQAQRPVLEAQLRQREAELTAARENLRLRIEEARALAGAAAAVADAAASRDEARLRLSRMEVRSPADGIVMQRLVEPGSKLAFGVDADHSAHPVRLYDPNKLQVRVDVPLADAAKVGVGQKAKIIVGVLPDRTFDGVVTRIVHEADIQKNTLQVKVAITDPTIELKPEMLARVRFLSMGNMAATTKQAQLVFAPEKLLHEEGGRTTAWIAARGMAELRNVEPGTSRQDGWVSIAAGLQPGDQLIASDTSDLRDGAKIRIVGEAGAGFIETAHDTKGGSDAAH